MLGKLDYVNEERSSTKDLAVQVVINFGAGLAGYLGPGAGALAQGTIPLALAGLSYAFATIGSRRLEHGAETLLDGAKEFGAETPEEFAAFIETAVSDEKHQELLGRALSIAQDTAMREKRRALGRALAAAASDTGTKVDDELLFIRVLADLDAPHIRVLRITSTVPPNLDAIGRQMEAVGQGPARQWYPWSIAQADPGLADVAWILLDTLERHRLLRDNGVRVTQFGHQPEFTIAPYGEWFLERLAD